MIELTFTMLLLATLYMIDSEKNTTGTLEESIRATGGCDLRNG